MSSERYVAVYPNTPGNSSNKYRVAKNQDWQKFINDEAKTYPFLAFDTIEEALEARDKANKDEERE